MNLQFFEMLFDVIIQSIRLLCKLDNCFSFLVSLIDEKSSYIMDLCYFVWRSVDVSM